MAQPDPQIAQWFHTVDKQQTGRLTAEQLQQALRNNNYSTFDIQVVHLMVGMFDRDNSRTINVHEFCDLWKYLGQWRKTFDQFDQDRSGNISKQELDQALRTMGYQFSPHFSDVLFRKFDYRKTGSLQFDGFVHSVILIQRLTGAFQQYDTQRNGNAHFTYENFLATVLQNT